MSATVDSTANGSNAPVADSSRLEQPGDAVAMESMPQSTAAASQAPVESGDATPAAARDIAQQQSSADSETAADTEKPKPTDASSPADAASPKPKEEGTAGEQADDEAAAAPAPPSKERERSDSVSPIGPATDEIKAVTPGAQDGRPSCNITLLLTSGNRHPFRFDGKYLGRRNVTVPEETEDGQPDPFSISVYTFKELILREWRNDWEAKPASPSSIRLIHFGKLLDDKEPLRKYNFSPENPNVVHMSIRPHDLDEEEPKAGNKSQASGGGDGQRSRGGCCVVL